MENKLIRNAYKAVKGLQGMERIDALCLHFKEIGHPHAVWSKNELINNNWLYSNRSLAKTYLLDCCYLIAERSIN